MHGKQEQFATSSVDADAQILIQNLRAQVQKLRAEVKSCKDRIAKLRNSKESLQTEHEDEIERLQQDLELAQSATQWKSDMKMAISQFEDVPAAAIEKQLGKTDQSTRPLTQNLTSTRPLTQNPTNTSETRELKNQDSKPVTRRDAAQTAAAQSIESVQQYILKVGVGSTYFLHSFHACFIIAHAEKTTQQKGKTT